MNGEPKRRRRVPRKAETATDVRVKVETLDWPIPLPQTAEAVLLDLTVPLDADLGARIVRDANGQVVRAR